jgi:hypothetical protein
LIWTQRLLPPSPSCPECPRKYPERGHRDLIVAHIYLRDWLLLVQLSILVFVRLLLRVSQVPRKRGARGKPAGGDPASANQRH